jgi:FKBP-type peptidyl-prolyl cis-trans isomerase
MRKTFISATALLLAGMVIGDARAQQAPTTNSSATPPAKAAQSPAKKAPAAPAAKSATPAPAAKSGTASTAGKTSGGKTLTLTTPNEKASYAIGLNVGKGMKRDSVEVNPDILLQGMKDGLSGAKQQLSDDEIKAVLTALQAHIRKMQEERSAQLADTNKKEGETFLAANKAKEGVVTLPDGLQYKILTEGTGPKPVATDSVVCNYRGTLIDGTEFDSSYKRGQPATFGVSQVIHGWTEALQLMPVGSKWQLFIPSALAYGERGASTDIGPNAMLIFEVELVSIQAKPAAAAPVPTPAPEGKQ